MYPLWQYRLMIKPWPKVCLVLGMFFLTGRLQAMSYLPFHIPLAGLKATEKEFAHLDYYEVHDTPKGAFIKARYLPSKPAVKLGFKVPVFLEKVDTLIWKWRVQRFPQGADERINGKGDSAGAIYCVFKVGWRTYTLKYVYSVVVPAGTEFRDDTFLNKMAVIVINQKDDKTDGQWRTVKVHFREDMERLFGFKQAPGLKGVGILTDGDGTHSEVSTDYSTICLDMEGPEPVPPAHGGR